MKINLSSVKNSNISISSKGIFINGKQVNDFSEIEDKEITINISGDVNNLEAGSGNITVKKY